MVILLLFLRQFSLNPSQEDMQTHVFWSHWHGSQMLSFKQTGIVCNREEEQKRFYLKQATESVYRDSFILMFITTILDIDIFFNHSHNSALICLVIDWCHVVWLSGQILKLHEDTKRYIQFVSLHSAQQTHN